MHLSNENPVFRKVIVPWFDSTVVMVAMMVFLLLVSGFAIIGIIAAHDASEAIFESRRMVERLQTETSVEFPPVKPAGYHKAVRIPILLLLLSLGALISSSRRLVLRYLSEQESNMGFPHNPHL